MEEPSGIPQEQARQRRYSPEVRRQMILDAAIELFREKPDATIDDVAAKAGVTRQLVGQHFPGGGVERIQPELMEQASLSFARRVLESKYPPPKTLKEWKSVIPKTARRYFEWAIDLNMPWMFAGEASGLPAAIGFRRSQIRVDSRLSGPARRHPAACVRSAVRCLTATAHD